MRTSSPEMTKKRLVQQAYPPPDPVISPFPEWPPNQSLKKLDLQE